MNAIKGLGIWIGGAIAAFLLMYMFGAGRGNAASIVFLGYIIWWGVQMFGLSTETGRQMWDDGQLSLTGPIIAYLFGKLKPLYIGVTGLLLLDSIINTKLAQNWITFVATVVVAAYLLKRNNNRMKAGNLLRGGRANVAPQSKKTGRTTTSKYSDVEPDEPAAPDMSEVWTKEGAQEFDQWLEGQAGQTVPAPVKPATPAAPKRSKYDTEE